MLPKKVMKNLETTVSNGRENDKTTPPEGGVFCGPAARPVLNSAITS
jgi:hypothetical protein